MHVYFAQHCFFLPLPHVLVGIQNAAATGEKTKDPSLHRENLYRFTNSGLRFTPAKGLVTAMRSILPKQVEKLNEIV